MISMIYNCIKRKKYSPLFFSIFSRAKNSISTPLRILDGVDRSILDEQKGWKGISAEFPSDFRLVTTMNRSRVYFPSKGVWRSSPLPGSENVSMQMRFVNSAPRRGSVNQRDEGWKESDRTLLKRHCNDKNICTCLDFFMIFFFFFFSSFFLFFFSLFFLIRVTSTPVSPFRLTFCSSSFSVPLFSFFSPLILFRLLYIYVSRRFPNPCFFPCCDAIFISLALFYAGNIILFTVSKIKPAFFFFSDVKIFIVFEISFNIVRSSTLYLPDSFFRI